MAKKKPKPKAKKPKLAKAAPPPKSTRRKRDVKIQPEIIELKLAQIDPSPAFAVRANPDQETIEKYTEAYKAGEVFPPVDVFHGGEGQYLLADGGNRYKARHSAGFGLIACRLHVCESTEHADEEAALFAAAANEAHGLRRSVEDRRAAVKSIIGRKKFADASDRRIADICKVTHTLVRVIRDELTAAGKLDGKASSEARDYKPDRVVRGGVVMDGKGGTTPKPVKLSEKQLEFPPEPKQAAKPDARPAVDVIPLEPPSEDNIKLSALKDAKGRPVPERLVPVFGDVATFERLIGNFKATAKEYFDRAAELLFASVSSNNMETDLENLIGNLKSGKPYVICPACDGTGQKLPAGPKRPECGTCGGKGWISHGGWTRLTEDQKEIASGYTKAAA